ncbi:MAG TPA: hypothetical protein VJ352_12115, partial [Geodermatophilus sp.]|nr:hypothetical protein [Geodermatophilus sp.]
MRRRPVVADQTLSTDTLGRAVQERIAAGPHEFPVVAPATPVQDEVEGPGAYGAPGPSAPDRAHALARQRLDRSLDSLHVLGGRSADAVAAG